MTPCFEVKDCFSTDCCLKNSHFYRAGSMTINTLSIKMNDTWEI